MSKITHAALLQLVDQMNSQYLPFGIEHDPRIPPQGRIVSAMLKELEDGEFGVEGVIELFEEGDKIELKDDGRVIPVREIADNRIHMIFDRSYRGKGDQDLIYEITDLVNGEAAEELKKAFEPLSVLTIAASVVLGSFFVGLFEKAGADAWDLFKEKVKGLIRRKRSKKIEHLLVFQFSIREPERSVDIETILSNPSDDEIEAFFETGLKSLDQLAPQLLNTDIDIRRIVLEYSDGELKVLFGVRKDAVPLYFMMRPGQ